MTQDSLQLQKTVLVVAGSDSHGDGCGVDASVLVEAGVRAG